MKKLLLISVLAITALLSGCTNTSKAEEVLMKNGYTNIKMTGYSFFGCSDSDSFSDGFEAKSPNGSNVVGVVCSGMFKGATIRFD